MDFLNKPAILITIVLVSRKRMIHLWHKINLSYEKHETKDGKNLQPSINVQT
jgi:hypothetical protein